jgi:hypothetical protein
MALSFTTNCFFAAICQTVRALVWRADRIWSHCVFANPCIRWLNVLKVPRRALSELGAVFLALQSFDWSAEAQSRLLALGGSDLMGRAVLLRLLDDCGARAGKERAYSEPCSYR